MGDSIKKIIVIILILIQLFLLCSCFYDIHNTNEYSTSINNDTSDYIQLEYDTYILNINSKKIHKTTCGTAGLILPKNKKIYNGDISKLYEQEYSKCGNCFRNER